MTIFSGQIAGSKLTLFFSIFWNLLNSIPLRYIWAQSIYRCYLWSRLKVSFVESEEKREKELPQRGDISIACNVTKVGPKNKLSADEEGSVFISPLLQFIRCQKPLWPPLTQNNTLNSIFFILIQSTVKTEEWGQAWEISHSTFAGEGLLALS